MDSVTRDGDGQLCLGGVALSTVVGDPRAGTPAYVYDLGAIRAEARAMRAAFDGAPHVVAYAVKANSAGAIVRVLREEGCGADVVSGPELALCLEAGVPPDRVVYSGVAKTDAELDLAIGAGILAIQIESAEEIPRVAARARAAARRVHVSFRVNPAVEREALATHAHIATGHDEAKFGIPIDLVGAGLDDVDRHAELALVGIGSHVGSQLVTTEPYVVAARKLFALAREVHARRPLSFVDTGGGFGVDYGAGCEAAPADFIRATRKEQVAAGLGSLALLCEPGRSLVAKHGVLVACILQRKAAHHRRWVMIDAGMNDLMRPALYQARHRIVPLLATQGPLADVTVVGPVCESTDDFGVYALPEDASGAVAILDAGAYGFTMASRYNGRALPAEVFVEGGRVVGSVPRDPPGAWIADRLRS